MFCVCRNICLITLSLLLENASPELISKNLAELKSVRVSSKNPEKLVLGADSVISVTQMTDKHPVRMKRITDDDLPDDESYSTSSSRVSKGRTTNAG